MIYSSIVWSNKNRNKIGWFWQRQTTKWCEFVQSWMRANRKGQWALFRRVSGEWGPYIHIYIYTCACEMNEWKRWWVAICTLFTSYNTNVRWQKHNLNYIKSFPFPSALLSEHMKFVWILVFFRLSFYLLCVKCTIHIRESRRKSEFGESESTFRNAFSKLQMKITTTEQHRGKLKK